MIREGHSQTASFRYGRRFHTALGHRSQERTCAAKSMPFVGEFASSASAAASAFASTCPCFRRMTGRVAGEELGSQLSEVRRERGAREERVGGEEEHYLLAVEQQVDGAAGIDGGALAREAREPLENLGRRPATWAGREHDLHHLAFQVALYNRSGALAKRSEDAQNQREESRGAVSRRADSCSLVIFTPNFHVGKGFSLFSRQKSKYENQSYILKN